MAYYSLIFETMATSNIYSLDFIQDEARQLVRKGVVSRRQAIYTLYDFIPAREWLYVERELEDSDYLLRDTIGELIGAEHWEND
jgi:hypothetical protein